MSSEITNEINTACKNFSLGSRATRTYLSIISSMAASTVDCVGLCITSSKTGYHYTLQTYRNRPANFAYNTLVVNMYFVFNIPIALILRNTTLLALMCSLFSSHTFRLLQQRNHSLIRFRLQEIEYILFPGSSPRGCTVKTCPRYYLWQLNYQHQTYQ